jgi:hypothetical protein
MNTRVCAAAAAAAMLLGACGVSNDRLTGEPTSSSQASTPTAAPSSDPATETPAVSEPTQEPSEEPSEEPANNVTTIGKTLTYESGLAVRVVSAKVFNPGEYALGLQPAHKAVKVTWTITNGTSATVDVSSAEARLTYGADGVEAESIYADGVDGQYPFDGSLLPGKRKTASSAFSVPKAGLSSITIEIEPDFDSETAFFTGKAG